MTLRRGLGTLRVKSAQRAAPERASPFEAGISALQRSGILDTALGAGQQAPDFELPRADGIRIRLGALLASGPAVVTFFRGGWCPYCRLQLGAYEAMLPELAALGARLVAVSPQRPDFGRDMATRALQFDVVSDVGNRVGQRYGLAFQLSQAWREAYARNGVVLPEINGEDADWRLPVPATFVVEPSGRVALSYVDADYRNRLEPAEILAALQSLR